MSDEQRYRPFFYLIHYLVGNDYGDSNETGEKKGSIEKGNKNQNVAKVLKLH